MTTRFRSSRRTDSASQVIHLLLLYRWLFVNQFHQRADGFVGRLESCVAALIYANEDRKIAARGDPNVGEIHRVVAGVIQDFAAPPTALGRYPAEGVIAAEGRGVQLPISVRLQQCLLAPLAAQLILDELRPILNRAMHAA